jgi:hypothetical protein
VDWTDICKTPSTYLATGTVSGALGATLLLGSVGFKSHLHNGHRVATVYTIRPKTEHFALGQIFMCATCFARSPEICAQFHRRQALINDTVARRQGHLRLSF